VEGWNEKLASGECPDRFCAGTAFACPADLRLLFSCTYLSCKPTGIVIHANSQWLRLLTGSALAYADSEAAVRLVQ
jgi:hypothetical protein